MDRQVGAAAWWASVAIGILAVALLVANNLRDIPTDSASGKRTLAVRLGANRTRHLYLGLLVASYLVVIGAVIAGAFELPTLAVLITFPLAARAGRAISAEGRELIAALQSTAALHAGFGLFLAGGLWLS
jgi:1,4-dihydroxy-2-naphthoate octaprenyltransferase